MSRASIVPLLMMFAASLANAQTQGSNTPDTTPHTIQFVAVERDVNLEVVDWGGAGRPIVLLAGLGMTAHELDQFALKLNRHFRVYGITRRGFGASSKPSSGYEIPRLVEDIVAVLDALQLKSPLLVGHSISGQELSLLGVTHAKRVAGIVFLDAAFDYTYKAPDEYMTLLAAVMPDSPGLKTFDERPASLAGFSPNWQILYSRIKPDYARIKTPALSIFSAPRTAADMFPDYETRSKEDREKMDRMYEMNVANVHYQRQLFDEAVHSKSLEIVGARHDVYRSNEDDVLNAIVEFTSALQK